MPFADDLALGGGQAGVARVVQDLQHAGSVPGLRLLAGEAGFGAPPGVVERPGDGAARLSAEPETEDEFDRGLALRVDLEAPDDLAILDRDGEPVAVRLDAGVFPTFDGSPAAGSGREPLATGVLMVALPGHNRVKQVPERVGVLDGADPHLPLQRP